MRCANPRFHDGSQSVQRSRQRTALAGRTVALLAMLPSLVAASSALAAQKEASVPDAGTLASSAPAGDAALPSSLAPGAMLAEARLADAQIRLWPATLRPGDFFEISVVGEGVASAAASFETETLPLFRAAPGRFRGWGAVPLEHAVGEARVHVAIVHSDQKTLSSSLSLNLIERASVEKTLRVSTRFIRPSASERAQTRADAVALRDAYNVPFGPPLFSANFTDPLAHQRGSRFGEKRVFNGSSRSRHWGLDIDGDRGDPVHAANDGVVVLTRACFVSGVTVVLSHGAGLFTAYLHFSSLAVKAGQAVKRGDVLGYVGSTGRVTGPHLHFAARIHDVLIDPEALLDHDFEVDGPAHLDVPK